MDSTAQKLSHNILITHVDSTLGANIARLFLAQNKNVYGISNKTPVKDVLEDRNFTLLDFDLSQPIPAHIAEFDLIVHLMSESTQTLKNFTSSTNLTGATANIISQAKNHGTKVILMAPLVTNNSFYESIAKSKSTEENLKLFLFGDIYSPLDDASKSHSHNYHEAEYAHFYKSNELNGLIYQAIFTDKIILEDEGTKIIVPTYIDDALYAFSKLADPSNRKNLNIIVSEGPKTSLSVAYEIQKAAQTTLNKQLKLYFSGPKKDLPAQPQPVIRLEYLGFEPKVTLAYGLIKVFESQGEKSVFRQVPMTNTHQQNQVQIPNVPAISNAQEAKLEPKKLHAPKLANKIAYLKTKRFFFALLLVLVLFFIKMCLDFYLGLGSFKESKLALERGNFETAKAKAQSAEKSFGAAMYKYKILSLPLVPVFADKRDSIAYALTSARLGSSALKFYAEGAKNLASDLKIITSTTKSPESINIDNASANFKNAYLASSQAVELAESATVGKVFSQEIKSIGENFKTLNSLSSTSLEFVGFIKDFTGTSDKKTYLVLIQNNTELRPGGGFIDSFGEITFEDGHLTALNFKDTYTIDSQLREKIDVPKEFSDKLGVTQLYLRDSNLSTDFAANGTTARDFYKKETGKEVNGVIAIDLNFLQNLLTATGPIKIENSSEEISGNSLLNHNASYDQIAQALFSKLFQSFSQINPDNVESINLSEFYKSFQNALSQKHLLFSFDNQNLSTLVKIKGLDNALPPVSFDPADDTFETRDFLALSEANLGANRANSDLQRKIDYEITLGRNADINAKLKITYINKAQKNTWPAGTYVNWLKVYAPKGSGLIDFQLGQTSDLKAVEILSQANLTVFSTFIEVPVGKTADVTFTYKIPKYIKLEQVPSYHLYIPKQPGTDKDPLTFTFNLPDNIEAKSVNGDQTIASQKNIKINSDLSIDRQFEIELKKK